MKTGQKLVITDSINENNHMGVSEDPSDGGSVQWDMSLK